MSTSPWIVKIADFGISKQCIGGTQLETQVGTKGYMAPELDGYFRNTYTVSRYSVSVDIWALGVITMELLLKHPFPYPSDQYEYIQDTKLLRFDDFSV